MTTGGRTTVQDHVVDYIDAMYIVENVDEMMLSTGDVVVEMTTFDGEKYIRFNIFPDGDTNVINYTVSHRYINKLWSMEENDWLERKDYEPKKEPSNKPSDVVVENKIKIEKEFKKMARCNFTKIAQEVNRERFKSWVEDNADDLVTYAEDVFTESYGTYMDDNCEEYESVAHEAIDTIIDNLWMGDYICEVEDPEGVIEDVIM